MKLFYIWLQFIEAPDRIIAPKEVVTAKVQLMYYPDVSYSSLNVGIEFDILEGARVVSKGQDITSASIN